MNTPFDDFIDNNGHMMDNMTVSDVKKLMSKLETLGMADYKIKMFCDEDSDDTADVISLVFEKDHIILSTGI